MLRFFLIGALGLFASFTFAQDTPSTGRTIVILDGSGSMWGQIDGETKMSIAKSVTTDIFSEILDTSPVGLIAYGHNHEGDCSDIETLVTYNASSKDALSKALEGVAPKGKTPLTQAVTLAAKSFVTPTSQDAIVLITDGLETCGGDPCALAETLKGSGINVKTHIVGFDLANEDTSALQCLADKTGGKYLDAGDRGGLQEALGQISEDIIGLSTDNVFLRAVDKDSNLINAGPPVIWTVNNDTRIGFEADFALPAGTYTLSAQRGSDMNIQTTLIVPKDEPLKQDIVFADGTITLSARLAEDSDTLSRLVLNWDIFGVGKKTRENKLTSEAGANVSFTLPSGTYYGNVTHRDLQVPFTTEILGGEIREQTVTLNAGYLRVKTSVEKGIVSVKAYRINGEKETLTGSEATTPRGSWFLLPEGTYRIIGTFRGKRAEKRVTLKPGDDQSITLTLPTP